MRSGASAQGGVPSLPGVGVDAVVVAELRRTAEETAGFCDRVFDPTELEACRGRADPWPCLAARFAAKEAVMKAFGTGWAEGVDFRDIVVAGGGGRPPEVRLRGSAEERAAGVRVRLSLTRAGGIAVAVAVLASMK